MATPPIGAPRRRRARAGGPAAGQERHGGRPIRAVRPILLGRDRAAALARVLPMWPHELADESAAGRARVVAKLHRALRAERKRGLAGHWTYDLARHVELLRLYRQELKAAVRGED